MPFESSRFWSDSQKVEGPYQLFTFPGPKTITDSGDPINYKCITPLNIKTGSLTNKGEKYILNSRILKHDPNTKYVGKTNCKLFQTALRYPTPPFYPLENQRTPISPLCLRHNFYFPDI